MKVKNFCCGDKFFEVNKLEKFIKILRRVKIFFEVRRNLSIFSEASDLELTGCGQKRIKILPGDCHFSTVEQGKEGVDEAGVGVGNEDGDGTGCLVLEKGEEEWRAGSKNKTVSRHEDIITGKSNISKVRLKVKLLQHPSNSGGMLSPGQRASGRFWHAGGWGQVWKS